MPYFISSFSHGHFYHIPTLSEVVADGQDGLWLTQFKGGGFYSFHDLELSPSSQLTCSLPSWTLTTRTGPCSCSACRRGARTGWSTLLCSSSTLFSQVPVNPDNVSPAKSCSRTFSAGQGDNKGEKVGEYEQGKTNYSCRLVTWRVTSSILLTKKTAEEEGICLITDSQPAKPNVS